MTRHLKLPTQTLAIALFALTGLAANPIADLVDCTDSFWIVACSEDDDGVLRPTNDPDIVIGEPVTIDNDPTCVEIDGGEFIVCHT